VSRETRLAAVPGTEAVRARARSASRRSRPREGGVELGQVAVAIRWAALVLVLLDLLATGHPSRHELVAGPILVVVAAIATVAPARLGELRARRPFAWAGSLAVGADAAIAVVLVLWTGGWSSPYLLSLGATLLVAGLDGGLGPAGVAGAVAAGGFLAGTLAHLGPAVSIATVAQRVVALALVGAVGVYGRWVVRRTAAEHAAELERQRSAAEANALLLELHAMAANQPAWLSLRAALQSTVARLREALDPDVVVVLLREPTTDVSWAHPAPPRGDVVVGAGWQVAVAEGAVLPEAIADGALPSVLARASRSRASTHVRALLPGEGVGPASGEGFYVPMRARGEVVGLIGAERLTGRPLSDPSSRREVEQLAEHAALAIDNARWFRRLRSLGAQEERARIARELHDRFGQALAAVGLSLDRLAAEALQAGGIPSPPPTPGPPPGGQHARLQASGTLARSLLPGPARSIQGGTEQLAPRSAPGPVAPGAVGGRLDLSRELHRLAGEVRALTRELREKLSDLRAETSERAGVAATLSSFLRRVSARSGIRTELVGEEAHRLPPTIEREVWRIAQEAITNAERHGDPATIAVHWEVADGRARLEVADDGCGLPASAPLRADAYGLLGMRERADAIGASLGIKSQPGRGTLVTVELAVDPPPTGSRSARGSASAGGRYRRGEREGAGGEREGDGGEREGAGAGQATRTARRGGGSRSGPAVPVGPGGTAVGGSE